MCLYGHDLVETIGPTETGLTWVIGKDRREGDGATFIGAEHVLRTLKCGPKSWRIGLAVDGAPARGQFHPFRAVRTRAD